MAAPATPTAAPATPAASTVLALNVPETPLAAGASFQVPIVLNGGTDVSSVALQLQYDPAKLQLAGIKAGDFLGRDGQPTGISHVEEPKGTVVISVSRPAQAHGITGTGVVAVLTFQAKASGQSVLNVTRAAVVNGAQQQTSIGAMAVHDCGEVGSRSDESGTLQSDARE